MQITKHKYNLETHGHTILKIDLPEFLHEYIANKDFQNLDLYFHEQVKQSGIIFETLKEFCSNLASIEFIISLRESKNEWEEDGIWHDDGSRFLAFSLSLTSIAPKGGILEIRRKGSEDSLKIETPNFGEMIIFKTGVSGYEHKINRVTEGARLIIAGWCT